jgi:hypothetical protein
MSKSEVIHIRLNSDTLEHIRQQAKTNCRTIAQQINFMLKTQQGGGNK